MSTTGRLADACATANGDPNKQNKTMSLGVKSLQYLLLSGPLGASHERVLVHGLTQTCNGASLTDLQLQTQVLDLGQVAQALRFIFLT